MIKHRIFISSLKNVKGFTLSLSKEESHHLVKVLRSKVNEKFEGLDGMGRIYKLKLESFHNHTAKVKILEFSDFPPPRKIELAIGIPKTKAMSGLVRRATEMGVSKITPLLTRFSSYNNRLQKEQGWRMDAIEACKQSGNPWLPEISQTQPFEEWINGLFQNNVTLFYGSLYSPRNPISYHYEAMKSANKIICLVGPEGDFSDSEHQLLKNSEAVPITLGSYVLRVETATICILSQTFSCFM